MRILDRIRIWISLWLLKRSVSFRPYNKHYPVCEVPGAKRYLMGVLIDAKLTKEDRKKAVDRLMALQSEFPTVAPEEEA